MNAAKKFEMKLIKIEKGWDSADVRDKNIERQLTTGEATPAHISDLRARRGLMTPADISEYLNQSIWTVYKKIKRGVIKAQRLGGEYRISGHQLADYLEAQG